MQLSRLRQHLVSVEEPYDAEARRARQREDTVRQDTLRQDTLRQDTLRQATVKLLSNNSQSHKAQAHAQVSKKGFIALYEFQIERLILSYTDIFFNYLVQ